MSIPAPLAAVSSAADVRFNGERPWDLKVHDARLYGALLRHGSLALGDGYVRGAWDCDRIDELICRLLRSNAQRPLSRQAWLADTASQLWERVHNPQAVARAFTVGERHYDIAPSVYEAMLDPQMAYSCGYWRQASDLATAQDHKLRLVCETLQLQPGMRLLDIGCGWGSLAAYACRHYGVQVFGITVSARQALEPDGLALLQTIGSARTLMAWWQNFEAAWPELRRACSEEFHRFWRYSCSVAPASSAPVKANCGRWC